MDAIVTAGGRIATTWAAEARTTVKALLVCGGVTLLERSVRALRGSRVVERICVVGPAEVEPQARKSGADTCAIEAGSGIDNLLRGAEALGSQGRAMVVASDLPFVRPEDIDDVVERTPESALLSYCVFTREEWEAAYPGDGNVYVPLADGEFTGGCVYVLDTPTLRRIEPMLQSAFAARKSVVGMARLLGPRIVGRLLLGRLNSSLAPTTRDVLQRVEQLTGCQCAIVRGCSPRIGADIDDMAAWRRACRELDGDTRD